MTSIIQSARDNNQKALSEHDAYRVITDAGIPAAAHGLANGREQALEIADAIGYPVVMKGCSHRLTHKTERGLVKTNIGNKGQAASAYDALVSAGIEMDGVLVVEMLSDEREFVAGLSRDPQFGPYVMFGVGGILTEALNDVSFRIAPLSRFDAEEMVHEISAGVLLGDYRGKPAVNMSALCDALIRLGRLGLEHEAIAEIDINPMIPRGDRLVAVDALVVLAP